MLRFWRTAGGETHGALKIMYLEASGRKGSLRSSRRKTQREPERYRGREGAHVKRSEKKNEKTEHQTSPHPAY